MKKTIIISAIALTLASCGAPKAGDSQAELDQLKSDKTAIEQQIKVLEEKIAQEGGVTAQKEAELVIVTNIVTQPFTNYIELQGRVDAEDNVTVTAQMPGSVVKVYVTEGQQVSRGQTLAELDNDATKKGIETMQSQLSFAKEIFAKQKALWDQKIGTQLQFLQAQNNVETLEKQIASMSEQLDMSKLVSPISGIIDAVDMKAGQIVSPGFSGIRIVNLSNLKVKGEVSESYSAQIQNGDQVKLVFPDLNKEVTSKISFTGKVINQQSRTFSIESKLASDAAFKPNMIAIMKIADYENAEAIVLSVNLIQKSTDASFVYIVGEENGEKIAKRQTITIGKIYGGKAEVTSGLKAGDQLITAGYQNLIANQPIQF